MLEIRQLSRTNLPHLPYEQIATEALGGDFSVSLVTVGDTRSHALNKKHRGKDKPTNVLSFPLGKKEGEMFLNLHLMKAEARREGRPFVDYTLYIFIHGLFHLAGLDHGRTMDAKEHTLYDRWRARLSQR